jgi:hypothetical protein
MSDTARSSRYEIRVEGVLDPRWTAWFEGLAIGSDDSQTVISGPVADQAALHGLLNRVCDLGLVLISVRWLGPINQIDPARKTPSHITPSRCPEATGRLHTPRAHSRFSSRARATASVRFAAPSLPRTWPTCFLTVSRVTTSSPAMA